MSRRIYRNPRRKRLAKLTGLCYKIHLVYLQLLLFYIFLHSVHTDCTDCEVSLGLLNISGVEPCQMCCQSVLTIIINSGSIHRAVFSPNAREKHKFLSCFAFQPRSHRSARGHKKNCRIMQNKNQFHSPICYPDSSRV